MLRSGGFVEDRDDAGEAGRGALDLERKAGDREAERRERVQVRELLHLGITDVSTSLMAFPNEGRVAGRLEAFAGMGEGSILETHCHLDHPHLSARVQRRVLRAEIGRIRHPGLATSSNIDGP